ncbi:MAG: SRPBCC family protein [Caulobacteraceae bacterium]
MTSKVIVALRVKANPERAFEVFTRDIGVWWRHNSLFRFTPRSPGTLAFEPGEGGRLTEILPNGKVFEIGRIRAWEPPRRLVVGWRQATFAPDQDTEVEITFEPVGEETRVSVTHIGWDSVPQTHVAKHSFPDALFLRRHGEWWQSLLASYKITIAERGEQS